jgi:hypothetical protein
MAGFIIRPGETPILRFQLYDSIAPVTVEAFLKLMPFRLEFLHARVSGQEIWTDHAPVLDIIQENASVFAEPGEIVIGPRQPLRNRISGCIGIFYGEGKLLDAGNIFGKVFQDDMPLLQKLGEVTWKKGVQSLGFEHMP